MSELESRCNDLQLNPNLLLTCQPMLSSLVRKIHIYAGLFVFTQFLVFGIAGVVATLQPSLERPKAPASTRYVPFEIQPGESDKSVAARVYESIRPAMSRPMPDWALRRTGGQLILDFYNINGIFRVSVLEDERRLKIDNIRNSTALFLEDIHAATLGEFSPPGLIQAWAVWNMAAMWALLLFTLSGAYLWLATRPQLRWAWMTLAGSTLVFGTFWVVFR